MTDKGLFLHRYQHLTLVPVVLAALLLYGAAGCAPVKTPPPDEAGPALVRLAPDRYPSFKDILPQQGLIRSLAQSMRYFDRLPPDRPVRIGDDTYTAAHMKRSLAVFSRFMDGHPSVGDLDRMVRRHFNVYMSRGRDNRGEVLFTGYYEPVIKASLTRDSQVYPVPLYGLPHDLVKVDLSLFSSRFKPSDTLTARVSDDGRVLPYYTRAEINNMKDFHQHARPIAWVGSHVDRFFLEVQGSGRLELADGRVLRVHYHGKNGHPYRSIGKYLIEQGEIPREEMSMQAIRAWLFDHPHRREEVLHVNPSFVFFKLETGGPYGSTGAELTPLRSIATDRQVFPPGALCFIRARLPGPGDTRTLPDQWPQTSGFVLNQDTGGAIKGAGRADLFCGHGQWAVAAAGHMKHPGRLYVLVLKTGS